MRGLCCSFTADAVLLVYDVTEPRTFFSLPEFLENLRNYNLQAEILLVGNKNDDITMRGVTVSMIKKFAAKENLEYIETSAKTGENVDEAFIYLARKFLFSEGIISNKPERVFITSTGQGSSQWEKKIAEDEETVDLRLSMTESDSSLLTIPRSNLNSSTNTTNEQGVTKETNTPNEKDITNKTNTTNKTNIPSKKKSGCGC